MDEHTSHKLAYKKGYEKGKQDAMKWIPVTERLPEHFGTFIVAVDERDNNSTVYVDCADFDCFAKRWKTWGYFEDGWEVTHWMPLPTPPKGE